MFLSLKVRGSSDPKEFMTVGSKTYFSADDGQSGEELWVSDGSEAGTYLLSDINTGPKDSSPRSITESEGAIYFSAKSDPFSKPNISTARQSYGSNSICPYIRKSSSTAW